MITLTRLYRFSASHRLHSPALGEAENERLYGKCNNPFGHGHDYILEVTATGTVDAVSGRLLPLAKLDQLVQEKILQLFANRNLNLDLPEFARLVPTTENIALVIARLLEQHWNAYLGPIAARLSRIHVQETDRNKFEVLLPVRDQPSSPDLKSERLPVHA
ncbi:MAG TPA: 6-carboxytetrahydropterin synthase [Bryobacteraceae bacterium]|jgi:6-pyruvoyltetrahydropterin/6-carboxytetrahydropterin synthase|nr:6-carboxytetrahydropterin synthase [Bryobacteraceae bacterium]